MIKKIEIKYFESHKDTEIEFVDGLNLLIGDSNSGKSSIVRSAMLVVANRFSSDMIRTGHTYCQVKITTEKGWVECQRGVGINKWKCFNGEEIQEYKNIGVGVPDIVPVILGMGERDRGEVKELPNFMQQLEKHYMLAEVDGKKATSNLVARMMDNAIGLGGMEDLIKDIATDLAKDKRELNEKTSEISEIKSKILLEDIFESYKKSVENCSSLNKKLNEKINCFKNAENDFKKWNEILLKIKSIKNFDFDYENNERKLLFLIKKTDYFELFKGIKNKLEKLSNINNIPELIEKYENVEKLIQKLNNAQKLFDSFKNKNLIIKGIKIRMKNDEKDLEIKVRRFNDLKKELGICPLCEREF